ncbi:MAG TPA: UDP-N-acetylmuramoyl-L-alanyl-D-glutamate--2,6-diaminopimelate ligase [Gemmatimonadales bacterium]|nr:UDP-N-acetylmuramoyl-L-alanyl-D-glutamate--2,6-diaminopimelate ligase [Gemmatimonadales bacterium]
MTSFADIVSALKREDLVLSAPSGGVALTGITDDTRSLQPGMLYVAVRGTQADGHRFVADAVGRGAAALVVESPQGAGVPEIVVQDSRRAAGAAARAWFGRPADHLALVAVTGTNGKTTTTALVRHLFNGTGSAGSIGTLGAFDGKGEAIRSTAGSLTTPGPVDLQSTLAQMVERGVSHVAMEASSHSLDQRRLDDLTFGAAIFTNLTRDHLDYHGTMEDYLAAKLRLRGLLGLSGREIVNADDPAWQAIPPGSRRITFGIQHPADVHAGELVLHSAGASFQFTTPWGSVPVRLPLLGDYNVANALGAAAAALAMGRPFAEVVSRLHNAPQVPGRMELLVDEPFVVLRDYAHTPDALERALSALRPLTTGRLLVVFGCGGDRDTGKRPVMGRIATELSDLPIVTSDNPRTEDPDAIIDDVERGMGAKPHRRITDRREAIHAALNEAHPGDTILLAGKGHETYQVIGREKLPFDERTIVLDGLSAR